MQHRHRLNKMISNLICFGLSVGFVWSVVNSGESFDFLGSPVAFEQVVGLLGIVQLQQEVEKIVTAGILSLIELSIAWVVLDLVLVSVPIIFSSLVVEDHITIVPSFESQTAAKGQEDNPGFYMIM
jgi:hypothetical protein